MKFTPTSEQAAIVDAARNSTDNLLVSALAGAAKTSSLELIAEALSEISILALCFNRKIATEMQERLPRNCTAKTLNSLGHSIWSDAIGRRLRIESSKIYDITSAYIEGLTSDEKKLIYPRMADLMNTVRFGKACGFIPEGTPRMKALMREEEFFGHLDEKLTEEEEALVVHVTSESIKQAWQGTCDYDDQILMPTLGIGAFPRYPLILIDEAQDLSALNHAMLKKLVVKRIICVGDSCQAIYGFRGAHEESMDLLKQTFNMIELPLSISFRCPRSVVEAARWRAPTMAYPDWAEEGDVRSLTVWSTDDIPDYAAIICRNNAPLFRMAIRLLKAGRYPELSGNDIGKALMKVMKKFGSGRMPKVEVLQCISDWKATMLAKARKSGVRAIEDKAECMTIFAEVGATLGDSIAYAEHLFSSSGPIKCMTGHKSKGLEFDNVYFLDRHLLDLDGQDRNLKYVIITRAKKTLSYITTEGYNG